MAGFEVATHGRFWVATEECETNGFGRLFSILCEKTLSYK